MIRKAALQIGVPALLALIAWNAYLAVSHLKRVEKSAALTLESSAIQADHIIPGHFFTISVIRPSSIACWNALPP